jgi:hypothetical protein
MGDVVAAGRGTEALKVVESRRGVFAHLERDARVWVLEVHFKLEGRTSPRANARPSSERGVLHEGGGEGSADGVGVEAAVETEGPIHNQPAYAQSGVQRGERKRRREGVGGTVLGIPLGILGTRGVHYFDASRVRGTPQTPTHARAGPRGARRGLGVRAKNEQRRLEEKNKRTNDKRFTNFIVMWYVPSLPVIELLLHVTTRDTSTKRAHSVAIFNVVIF